LSVLLSEQGPEALATIFYWALNILSKVLKLLPVTSNLKSVPTLKAVSNMHCKIARYVLHLEPYAGSPAGLVVALKPFVRLFENLV
jgi:hypothetical protein